ncbi:hypothetical protein CYMTET_23453 [Cymbomonas tetramitiformis]|uniref:Uncharacterized protein n=1 Tax=Cymbomonas tetramitiformis TaxID=36881 RepID=A0AAE0FYA2_9CHLO|nr:hypothetical protein CYMTET_23453 [Cymbomonas tetramitiformis]
MVQGRRQSLWLFCQIILSVLVVGSHCDTIRDTAEYKACVSAPTACTSLVLCKKSLSGSLPSDLGLLSQLVLLQLSSNNLTGTIPTELGMIKSLLSMELDNNHLTGSIPTELGDLAKLQHMHLHTNSLAGLIPDEILQHSTLKALDLHSNSLHGSIALAAPHPSGPPLVFQRLELYDNSLTGALPVAGLCARPGLIRVALGGNALTGTLPPCLANLTALQELRAEGNQLSGTLPEAVCLAAALTQLFLADNRLSGSLPACLLAASPLRNVSLGYNALHGTLPKVAAVTTPTAPTRILDLQHNQLRGTVPAALAADADSFQALSLSSNQFSCELPSQLAHLEGREGGAISVLKGNQFGCWAFGGYKPTPGGLHAVGLMDPAMDPGAATYWCGNSQFWLPFLAQGSGLVLLLSAAAYSGALGRMGRPTLGGWWRGADGAWLRRAVGAVTGTGTSVALVCALAWSVLAPVYHWKAQSRYTCQHLHRVSLALKVQGTSVATLVFMVVVMACFVVLRLTRGGARRFRPPFRILALTVSPRAPSDAAPDPDDWAAWDQQGDIGHALLAAHSPRQQIMQEAAGSAGSPDVGEAPEPASGIATWWDDVEQATRMAGAAALVLATCAVGLVPDALWAYADNEHPGCIWEVFPGSGSKGFSTWRHAHSSAFKLALPAVIAATKVLLRGCALPCVSELVARLLVGSCTAENRQRHFRCVQVTTTILSASILVLVPLLARALGDNQCFAAAWCNSSVETYEVPAENPYCSDMGLVADCCMSSADARRCNAGTSSVDCDLSPSDESCLRSCSMLRRCQSWRPSEPSQFTYARDAPDFNFHLCTSAVLQAYAPIMILILGMHVWLAALALVMPLFWWPLPKLVCSILEIPIQWGHPVHLKGLVFEDGLPQIYVHPIQIHSVSPGSPLYDGEEVAVLSPCSVSQTPLSLPQRTYDSDTSAVLKLEHVQPYGPDDDGSAAVGSGVSKVHQESRKTPSPSQQSFVSTPCQYGAREGTLVSDEMDPLFLCDWDVASTIAKQHHGLLDVLMISVTFGIAAPLVAAFGTLTAALLSLCSVHYLGCINELFALYELTKPTGIPAYQGLPRACSYAVAMVGMLFWALYFGLYIFKA